MPHKENIARRLEVDSNHVYIAFDNKGNPSYLEVDGKEYYHVLKNTENGYVIEQINLLVGSDIKHVEGRSMNFYLEVAIKLLHRSFLTCSSN